MIYLCAVNIRGILDPKEISEFTSIISSERIHKVNKYIYNNNKIQSILAETLLRYMLQIQCNMKQNEVSFAYNAYGKPYLTGTPQIYFNLSHSGEWIVCGICDNSIGIDIEQISEKDHTLLWNCLSPEEYYYILEQPKENQKDSFYKIWTLKESYIKFIGMGLSIPLDSFTCRVNQNDICLWVDNQQESNLYFKSEKIDSHYYISVCVYDSYKDMIGGVNVISLEELKKWAAKV